MKRKDCFKTDISGYNIELQQTGLDSFTVTYGLQVDKGLSYQTAAKALGECIMHAAACAGNLANGY